MAEELKILEDYLESVHQRTDGQCPICGASDYPVNGDKEGYDEVLPEDAEEYHCDHDEDCVVTVIDKFITAWNKRPGEDNKLLEALEKISAYESGCFTRGKGYDPHVKSIAEQAIAKA